MEFPIRFSKNQKLPPDYAVYWDDLYEHYFWAYKTENDHDYIYDGPFSCRFHARRCALYHFQKNS